MAHKLPELHLNQRISQDAANDLHHVICNPHKIPSYFSRKVEPKPPVRLLHGHLYDLLKPLWLELRLLGVLPVEKITTGNSFDIFSCKGRPELYTYTTRSPTSY